MAASHTPILVEMLSGYATTDLTTGLTNSCRFDESNKQWLYLDVEALQERVPYYKDMIDVDNLITLEHLEPVTFTEAVVSPEFASPTESEEFEAITASQAAELSKRKILRELMDRIRKAISSDFGVFELKVPDLDLDPVTPELEELGYVVRFSMQDDEFTILWEPKL
nr:MAG TPA: hypothetical protein [Caudoviricetes sp.]